MIMISKEARHARDGQALLGALDVKVNRNHFGSQVRHAPAPHAPSPKPQARPSPHVPRPTPHTNPSQRAPFAHTLVLLQVDSFATPLSIPVLGETPFPGVFIRAPIILEAGPDVEVRIQHPCQGACTADPPTNVPGPTSRECLSGPPSPCPLRAPPSSGPHPALFLHSPRPLPALFSP